MRRQQPIAHLLYDHLFPHPTSSDPASFAAHLARNLVPEVRIEVATFYGDLNSTEARYPGLNYCHGPHRLRLGRFKHHRRLFDAFDTLGLTYGEIQDFCCWEGTKWARERYEKDEGIKVLDTTGDDIGSFVDRRVRSNADDRRRHSITRKTDISVVVEAAPEIISQLNLPTQSWDEDMSDVDADPESRHNDPVPDGPANHSDRLYSTMSGGIESSEQNLGHAGSAADLQRRRDDAIRQRIVAAYERGQTLPPEVEQYLKEQRERGMLPFASQSRGRDSLSTPLSTISQSSTTTRPAPLAGRVAI